MILQVRMGALLGTTMSLLTLLDWAMDQANTFVVDMVLSDPQIRNFWVALTFLREEMNNTFSLTIKSTPKFNVKVTFYLIHLNGLSSLLDKLTVKTVY